MMQSRSQKLASQIFKFAACSANFSDGNLHLYEGNRLTADYTNPKWVERHRHMFHKLDRDNNGFVTLDEFVYKASHEICKNIEATPEQTDKHTEAVTNFFSGAGMRFGVESKWPEYIKGWEVLIDDELEKWANKEPTLIRAWGGALFDIIDKSGDNAIDLEEWQFYHKCAGVFDSIDECKATFDVCDANKDGKIDVEEMTRQHVGFWYTADPVSDGLYGNSVP